MERQKVLITGITGFAGSHLAELLVKEDRFAIYGTSFSQKHSGNNPSIQEKLTIYPLDLQNSEATKWIVGEVKPDVVYHLAASTSVAYSFKNPAEVITNNAASQVNILEAVRQNQLQHTKVVVVSSANAYGFVSPEDLPLKESAPFKPDNPYSVSKITQDYIGLMYYLGYKLPVIRMRPFNHLGPRLSPDISVSRFAKTIAEIEKGKQEPVMQVGNLSTKRDFTDVRDIVRAYLLAVEKGDAGEVYNVGSGVAYTMQEILDKLLNLSTVKIEVTSDPNLFRPSDIPELRCNATKFMQKTGWKPEVSLEQTLHDTLEYWRGMV